MSCYRAGNGALVHTFSAETQHRSGEDVWVCECGWLIVPRPHRAQVAQELVWASAILLTMVGVGAVAWLIGAFSVWVSQR